MNPTNQNQGDHSQRSFTFGPIDLKMLNVDASSAGVPAQAHNEAGRAFNSSGNSASKCFIKSQDILMFNSKSSTSRTVPVSSQAPTSFLPISLHLGGNSMPSGSFPAGPLPVNSYLPPVVPPFGRLPLIGTFSAGPPTPSLPANSPIPSMRASSLLAGPPAVLPILGLLAGPPIIPGPLIFGTSDFGGPCRPNAPSFSPTPVQLSHNANIERFVSSTPSSPISWSPSPPPLPRIPLPGTEPTPSLSRKKNVRGGRVRRAGRGGRSGQGRGNTWGGTGQSKESRQNSLREDQESQKDTRQTQKPK